MQNCKIEPTEQSAIQQSNAGTTTQQIQLMPTVLGHGGQQILLQSLQPTIGANGQQQVQVVPIQALGQGGTIIVQPQVQAQPQPQIVQLPDGQIFISQPIIPEAQTQTQIVNINGNYYQIPTQQTAPAQQTNQAALQASPVTNAQAAQNPTNQQVMMMTTSPAATQVTSPVQNDSQTTVTNLIGTTATGSISPPPNSTSPTPQATESEEEPLYVNASKLKKNK